MHPPLTQTSIFISYAWGGGLENKEWVRQRVVSGLDWHYPIFWDRDSIAFGESIDGAIGKALAARPLLVFCLCDQDYLDAAQHPGSGLYRELEILKQIADQPGVRIVPLIFEAGRTGQLPEPLTGRVYLDLQPLDQQNLDVAAVLMGVVEGVSQAQIQKGIADQLARFHLRQNILDHLSQRPITLWGSARTHEVMVHSDAAPPFPLLAPQWMWESNRWGHMLGDDNPTYCPLQGRWHWDHFSPGSAMQALGTAALAAFFPQLTDKDDQQVLNAGGALLAERFFSKVRVDEAFTFDADDLVTFMISHAEGLGVLERLLSTVSHRK